MGFPHFLLKRARPPPVSEDKLDRGVLKVAGVVVLGAIMSILDVTVVSVALPTLDVQRQLDAPSRRR